MAKKTDKLEQINIEDEFILVKRPNYKKRGLIYILFPFFLSCILLVIASLLGKDFMKAFDSYNVVISILFQVFIGIMVMFIIFGFWFILPIGIAFLYKKKSSYYCFIRKTDYSANIKKVAGWNWGAAFLGPYWGMYYNVWWVLILFFIPILDIFLFIFMGIKGNEIAYSKNKWMDVDEFKKGQKKWKIWGILAFILIVLATVNDIKNHQKMGQIKHDISSIMSDIQNYEENGLDISGIDKKSYETKIGRFMASITKEFSDLQKDFDNNVLKLDDSWMDIDDLSQFKNRSVIKSGKKYFIELKSLIENYKNQINKLFNDFEDDIKSQKSQNSNDNTHITFLNEVQKGMSSRKEKTKNLIEKMNIYSDSGVKYFTYLDENYNHFNIDNDGIHWNSKLKNNTFLELSNNYINANNDFVKSFQQYELERKNGIEKINNELSNY